METFLVHCFWPSRRVPQSLELLEFLQHKEKDEGGWGAWWQWCGQWCWGCPFPGWKRVLTFHKEWNLCFCCGGAGGVDGSGGGDGVDGSGGNSGVGDSGRSIVYRIGGVSWSIVYRSGRGGLCRRSGWYFGVGWGFCGGSGGRSETGGGVWCCEASPVVCEWKRRFFVTF